MASYGPRCSDCGMTDGMGCPTCRSPKPVRAAADRLRDFTRDWSPPERADVEQVIADLKRKEEAR